MYRLSLIVGAFASAQAVPVAARPNFIDAKLLAESNAPRGGHTILLGLEMIPQKGWHGYWSNPGESGLAPVVKWTAPHGVRFGPLEHPAPSLMSVMGMTSYVHTAPHILLARMTLDRNLPAGTALVITADVTWAACSDKLCVPQKARMSLPMRIGNGSPSAAAGLLKEALAHEPKRLAPGSFTADGARIVLRLPPSARLTPTRTHFFPDENGYWDPLKARVVSAKPLALISPARGKPPKIITGVVSDGSTSYRLSFNLRTRH